MKSKKEIQQIKELNGAAAAASMGPGGPHGSAALQGSGSTGPVVGAGASGAPAASEQEWGERLPSMTQLHEGSDKRGYD